MPSRRIRNTKQLCNLSDIASAYNLSLKESAVSMQEKYDQNIPTDKDIGTKEKALKPPPKIAPEQKTDSDNCNSYLLFDGDNSYPGCQCCGSCCVDVNILCVSYEEIDTIKTYIEQHHISPTDYNKKRCCFMDEDNRCKIWEVRPQTCRLYNCHVPRKDLLKQNPSLVVDDDKPLIDMHDAFIEGNIYDPRYCDDIANPHSN